MLTFYQDQFLHFFPEIACSLSAISKKPLPNFWSQTFTPKCFIVLSLTFRCLIDFEISMFNFICMWVSSVLAPFIEKTILLSLSCFGAHDLFLKSQFYSIDLYAYFYASILVLIMENKCGIMINWFAQ